ncbi:transcriptional adapter 2-beta-like [Lampetra fluviatilis]
MADAMAPKRKYCVNCLADATAVRVRCADCPDIELCLECFASGAELGTHRRGHAFRLEDAGTFPLFDDPGAPGPRAPPWSCLEEQQLLEAVEQHGLGNWADVGAHVNAAWCSAMGGPTGTGGGGGPGPGVGGGGGSGGGGTPTGAASGGGPGARSPADVARHFMAAYVYGSVGRACVPEVIPNRVTDHTAPEPPVDRVGGGSSSPPPPPVPPISAEEQQTLGYMPLRDDFEMEFLPHAETPVSELPSFEPDEVALVTETARSSSSSSSAAALDHHDGAQLLELELKMAVVCAYVRALHQRELRKAAAREYGLVQAFFGRPCALQAAYAATTAQGAGASPPTAASGGGTQAAAAAAASQEPPAKRKMAKEEKELLHKLRPLCRLVPAREFVELLEGARRERCLRERVRELQRARARSGVRRLDDFAALRRNKRRFGQAQQQQQQQGAGSGTSGHNGRERADAAAADAEAEDACGYARALSERESALCSSMNLSPARYVTAKTIAVLQSSTHRHARRLQQQQAQQQAQQQQVLGQQQGKGRSQGAVPLGQGALPMLLEKAVRKKLMGFLGRSGWVGGAGGREVL